MNERQSELVPYRFDQMADQINKRVMPDEADVERYVGLEHLDPDSLRIRRWGDTSEVESTKLLFQPGDIIFGKRRVYQRKVAVADFEGICSAHAMVLRAKPETVLPEFLPFFMQSDLFMERALSISVGSLSPTINWTALAKEEFLLPPMQEQARLVELLSSAQLALDATANLKLAAKSLYYSASNSLLLPLFREDIRRSKPEEDYVKLLLLEEVFPDISDGNYSAKYPKSSDFVEKGVPFFAVADFEGGEVIWSRVRRISEVQHSQLRKGHLKRGDLLVSTRASIGEVFKVSPDMVGANINAQLVRIGTHNSLLSNSFAWHLLRSPTVQREILSRQTGSAQMQLPLHSLLQLRLPVPSVKTQEIISERLDSLEEAESKIHTRHNETISLVRCMVESALVEAEDV